VRGRNAVVANLYAALPAVQRRVRAVVRRNSADVRSLAWDLCPKDTVRMANSLTEEFSPDGLVFSVFFDPQAFLEDGVDYYAPDLEFGTANSPAQPSLGPAYDAIAPHFQEDVGDAVRRAVNSIRYRAG
jgi:hypothetical protein